MRYVVVAVLLAGATACSTNAAPVETAYQVVTDLTSKISTAQAGVVYTAETDPNHLLGRPNGYTSKASVTDTRIHAGQAGTEPGSVAAGGSVEVFSDEAATARKKYIDEIGKAAPALANEYSYLDGPVLVRVSGRLTPDQAADYQKALAGWHHDHPC